jgi:hypothetical protein
MARTTKPRRKSLKQIQAMWAKEALKPGYKPKSPSDLLADVRRDVYHMNTRVKVDTAPAKHADRCDLKCIHGLQPGKGTAVPWNGLRVLLCGTCLPKYEAGAMIISLRHAKAWAARAAKAGQ